METPSPAREEELMFNFFFSRLFVRSVGVFPSFFYFPYPRLASRLSSSSPAVLPGRRGLIGRWDEVLAIRPALLRSAGNRSGSSVARPPHISAGCHCLQRRHDSPASVTCNPTPSSLKMGGGDRGGGWRGGGGGGDKDWDD